MTEIDLVLDAAQQAGPGEPRPEDIIPAIPDQPVTQLGDVWYLDRHRLIGADALTPIAYHLLLDGEMADLIFTDPPYNVPIDGHVCGLGRIRHREFAMGAGEMSSAEFTAFLTDTLGLASDSARDGAIAFVCMDWRHLGELLAAGRAAFTELKNLCVWNKINGGMDGSSSSASHGAGDAGSSPGIWKKTVVSSTA